jgi:hypothetical protein
MACGAFLECLRRTRSIAGHAFEAIAVRCEGPAAHPSLDELTNQSSPIFWFIDQYYLTVFVSLSGSRSTFNLADHVVHSMYKIPLPFRPLSRYVDRGPFALLLLKPDGAVLDLRERFDSPRTLFIAPNEDLLVECSSRGDHAARDIRFSARASRVSQHALHHTDSRSG